MKVLKKKRQWQFFFIFERSKRRVIDVRVNRAMETAGFLFSPFRAPSVVAWFWSKNASKKDTIKINRHTPWINYVTVQNKVNARSITERHSSNVWLNTKSTRKTARKRYCRNVVCNAACECRRRVIGGARRPRALDVCFTSQYPRHSALAC